METRLAGCLNGPRMVSMLEVVVVHPPDDPSSVMALAILLAVRSHVVDEMGLARRIRVVTVEAGPNVPSDEAEMRKVVLRLRPTVFAVALVARLAFMVALRGRLAEMDQSKDAILAILVGPITRSRPTTDETNVVVAV